MSSRAVASSSITSTQSLVGARPPLIAAFAAVSAPAGSRTAKTEPLPSSLVTVTSPPIMRASLRVMASPSPVPPNFCAVEASAVAELLEQLRLLLRGHADAGVGDGELDEVAAIAHLACRKFDFARFGELAGIAEEIEQDLPQPHGVHGQSAKVLLGFDDEPILVLLGKLSGGADDLLDQRCVRGCARSVRAFVHHVWTRAILLLRRAHFSDPRARGGTGVAGVGGRVVAVRACSNRQARELRLEPAGRIRRMAVAALGPLPALSLVRRAQAAPHRMVVELSLNGHTGIALRNRPRRGNPSGRPHDA